MFYSMRQIKKIIFCIFVVMIFLLTGIFARDAQQSGEETASTRRLITIDDLFKIKRVSGPQISPEGKWIAYTVTETDLEKNTSETAVWMIPSAGGEALCMTGKGSSASSPRWSPDGKYLSFTASRNESKTQVWVLNRLGGEAQPLTAVPQGISGYAWSPDGKKLLLSISDPKPEDLDEKVKKEKAKKPDPWVIDRLQFKRDNTGYLDNRRTHLYVYDIAADTLTQITSGEFDESQPKWSPDGCRIAFVSNRTDNPDGNRNTDIWIVAADNPDKGKTLLQVTINPGSDSSPEWSPDGKSLVYTTVTEPEIMWYATSKLAVIPASGGEPRILTGTLDRNIYSPRLAPTGKSVYFLLEDSGENHLARIEIGGGNTLVRPVSGPRSVRDYDLDKKGNLTVLVSEPHLPGEIFAVDGKDLRRLTNVNDALMGELRMAEVKNVQFPSKDRTEIEGFIFKPIGFKEGLRYPTLLRIHGGPVDQYDFSFSFESQLFAANGYLVINVNPRGSSGYGRDFSMGIYRSWGEKDFEDVMAGVDFAVEKGWADPDRLGVGGWSYGGILTNYVITQTDRFKAAITGASEVLFRSNYGHDHYQYEWETELGLPWENAELWEKLSPFNRVVKITTPTLIMGGEKDWNVPILNSEQLYQALRRLGRTTQLVVYPGQHHGIRLPSLQKDRLERYLKWYGKYVKNEKDDEGKI